MKKNIKLIGVAAAALLAVAPVVATTSTANAAIRVNDKLMNFTYAGKDVLNLNISFNAIPGKTTVKEAINNMKFSLGIDGKGTLPANIEAKDITITENGMKLPDSYTFIIGDPNYVIHIGDLKISGLADNQEYAITGGWFDNGNYNQPTTKFSSSELAKSHSFTSENFSINDPSAKVNGYFTKNGKKLSNSSYEQGTLTKETISIPTSEKTMSVKEVAEKIVAQNYDFIVPNSDENGHGVVNRSNDPSNLENVEKQVEYALKYADISYNKDGQFTIPNSKKLGNIKFIYITDDGAHNTLEITADFAEKSSSSSSGSSTTTPSTNVNTDNSSTTTSSSSDNSSTTSSSANTSSSSSSTTSTNTEEKLGKKHSMTVMYNAYVYNKDHERVGTKTIKAFSKINIYGKKTTLNDGEPAYQIGKGEYIVANNVTGVKRTLKHNAFIYSTSKKRANRKVLKKGAKITTYGGKVTFKNGKQYYRIEGATKNSKMYVKVANFK